MNPMNPSIHPVKLVIHLHPNMGIQKKKKSTVAKKVVKQKYKQGHVSVMKTNVSDRTCPVKKDPKNQKVRRQVVRALDHQKQSLVLAVTPDVCQ